MTPRTKDATHEGQNPGIASTDGSLHLVFTDLRRAFDTVSRDGLWLTLRRQGVPPRLLAVTRALHVGMEARVRVGTHLSDPFPVENGVRQGCVVAPALLNLFYGAALAEWRRRAPPDVEFRFAIDGNLTMKYRTFRAHGRSTVSDVTYADDTMTASRTWETAKGRWHAYVDVAGRFGLTINVPKTKHLVAGRDDTGGVLLAADTTKHN